MKKRVSQRGVPTFGKKTEAWQNRIRKQLNVKEKPQLVFEAIKDAALKDIPHKVTDTDKIKKLKIFIYNQKELMKGTTKATKKGALVKDVDPNSINDLLNRKKELESIIAQASKAEKELKEVISRINAIGSALSKIK